MESQSTCHLKCVPTELVFMVLNDTVLAQRDVAAFAKTSRLYYAIANPVLYSKNIRESQGLAGLWAIMHGSSSVGTLTRLVENGADVVSPEWRSNRKAVESTKKFRRKGSRRRSDWDCSDWQGSDPASMVLADWNPLVIAAARGDVDVIQYLLGLGADVNGYGNPVCECYPMQRCSTSSRDCERNFTWEWGDQDICFDRVTPLHSALCRGHLPAVKLLLSQKADLSNLDRDTKATALDAAIQKDQVHVIEYLLDEKILGVDDINKPDATQAYPLHKAYMGKSYKILDLLLERGADIEAKCCCIYDNSWTVFAMACACGDAKSALKFLEAGADPDLVVWNRRVPHCTRVYCSPGMKTWEPWSALGLLHREKLPAEKLEREAELRLRLKVEEYIFAVIRKKASAVEAQSGDGAQVTDEMEEEVSVDGSMGGSEGVSEPNQEE